MSVNRRTQVTFFIIIAIFVIVIFAVSMIILSNINQDELEGVSTPIFEARANLKHFNAYIQSCLQDSLEEGLFLLGRQGGTFFKSQPGSIVNYEIDNSYYSFLRDNVTQGFNITFVNDKSIHNGILSAPRYPCLDSSVFPPTSGVPLYLIENNCTRNYTHSLPLVNAIPWSELQTITTPAGRKFHIKTSLCEEDIKVVNKAVGTEAFNETVCTTYGMTSHAKMFSVQNQTEEYIKYRLENCFDDAYSFLTDNMNATPLDKGDYNVTVTFGDERTSATLKFPLTLTFGSGEAYTESFDFYAETNVRFKLIYALLFSGEKIRIKLKDYATSVMRTLDAGIIFNDLNQIAFDVEMDSYDILYDYSITGINITRQYDQDGSIIRIVDSESELKGYPYEFFVRFRNRRPALDALIPGQIKQYDIVLYENQSLIIGPEAYDLDDEGKLDEELTYFYEVIDEDWKAREPDFINNPLYETGIDQDLTCTHSKYGITKNKCSKFLLNQSIDLGRHTLKVGVRDRFGLEDYQLITILVNKKSNITFDIKNIFPGVPSWHSTYGGIYVVSPEDPFILSTEGSFFTYGGFTDKRISWEDTKYDKGDMSPDVITVEPDFEDYFENHYFYTDNKTIVYPSYRNFSNFSWLNEFLDLASVNLAGLENGDVIDLYTGPLQDYMETYDINYQLGYPISLDPGTMGATELQRQSSILMQYHQQGSSEQTERAIFIADCIPYRDASTPSYPYSTIRPLDNDRVLNPYYGDHTCCAGDPAGSIINWRAQPGGFVCYETEEFGLYYDFMEDPDNFIDTELFRTLHEDFAPLATPNPLIPDVLEPTSGKFYYRTFDQYRRYLRGECDGERGNVCYPQEYSIKKIPYCGINTHRAGGLVNERNNTIADTMVPHRPSSEEDKYYDSEMCLCMDNGAPRFMQIGNASMEPAPRRVPHEQMYCCTDENGVPYKTSNQSCLIMDCVKSDVYDWPSDPDPERLHKIEETGWDINDNTKLPPLCKCGNEIVHQDARGENFCCNPIEEDRWEVCWDQLGCIDSMQTPSKCLGYST